MKIFSYIIFTVIMLCCAGCGAIAKLKSERMDNRYYATGVCFQNAGKDSASRWVDYDNLWCYTPIVLVDVPISFVVDTISYPFDLISYRSKIQDTAFWDKVIKSNDSSKEYREYEKHFDGYTSKKLSQLLSSDGYRAASISSPLIDILTELELSRTDKRTWTDLEQAIASHPNIGANSYRKMYEFASISMYDHYLLTRLARNPATPRVYFNTYIKSTDYDILNAVASNKSLPSEIAQELRHILKNKIESNANAPGNSSGAVEAFHSKEVLKVLDKQ